MKRVVLLIVFLFFGFLSFAQQEFVQFPVAEKGDSIIIYGYNKLSKPLEVTLTLTNLKNLSGYSNPITKKVPGKAKVVFTTLNFKNPYSYNLSFTYQIVKPSKITAAKKLFNKRVASANLISYYLKDRSKINEGIVIFDDGNCGRTRLATNFFIGNEIDFKIINIQDNVRNTKLMWNTLKEKGANLNFQTPIIIVNGVLSHSHKDLPAFLEELKKTFQ